MGWLRRLRDTLAGSRVESALDEELQFHLDARTDEYVRQGLTPEEARRAARRRFGNIALARDQARDVDTLRWLDECLRDARFAVRMLRRNPVFALTALLSLAIGIGANTTVFSVVNALLLRPPTGVADPDRVVDIGVSRHGVGFNPGSYPNYLDIKQRATTLDEVYATELFGAPLVLSSADPDNGVESVSSLFVTRNYFTALGAVPAAGRLFDPSDQRPAVVLSYRFWSRRFGNNPALIGRTLRLNDVSFTITGVLGPGVHGTRILERDVWLPIDTLAALRPHDRALLQNREAGFLAIGGRLKSGVSLTKAAAELQVIGRALEREFPKENRDKGLRATKASAIPGSTGPVAVLLALLMAAVSLVLMIACANLAGVLLARAASRRREIAVRLAIGAGRARLVRQLLTEAAMLCVVGGAAGLLLAHTLIAMIVSLLPALPFAVDVSLALDSRVILFTTVLSALASIASGLVPALQASKAEVVPALKDDAEGSSTRSRLRDAFVVAQITFSIILVVASGLFVRALQRAGSTDPGFESGGVTLASVDLSLAGYDAATGPLFARQLTDRVRLLPQVQSATMAVTFPGGFESIRLAGLSVPGAARPAEDAPEWNWNIVEPGYFATLRIPLVSGRDFDANDRATTQPVVIVGEAAARYFWPHENAIGKFLKFDAGGGGVTQTTKLLLVVGVAHDVKSSSLIDGLSPSFIYVPLQQQYTSTVTIAARTRDGRSNGGDIRKLVASMNSSLPLTTVQMLDEYTALGLVPHRLVASFAGVLGLVGLLLAAIGVYGVTAYAVSRRTREFGVRIALGATASEIMRMVLWRGMVLIVIGCAIGISLSAAISRLLAGLVFGIQPLDPFAFGLSIALFVMSGIVACYGPARRATRIDAIQALRRE